MPKLKTRKTIKKRVRLTASGKMMRGQYGLSHLRRKSGASRSSRQKQEKQVSASDIKRIAKLI